MKDFDIRDYMWNIYEISNYNKLNNINMALNMFLENLELGYCRYEGATDIDYSELSEIWNNKPESFHKYELMTFNRVLDNAHSKLCRAWNSGDRGCFDTICKEGFIMNGIVSKK